MLKIILVDDEPLMRVALNTMVDYQANGFEVCGTAANGKEALKLIYEYQPEIVITDLKMPVMGGIELIREIQAQNYWCKILVISNYSDFDLVREALKLGAVDYLLKIDMTEEVLLQQLDALRVIIQQDHAYWEQQEKQLHYVNSQQKKGILRDFFSSSELDIDLFLSETNIPLEFKDMPGNLFYLIPENDSPDSQCWIDFSIIENILEETLGQAELTMEMFTLFPTGMVLLTPVADIALPEFTKQLQKILQTYISAPCTIIYTKGFVGYTEAKNKFQLCKNASNLLFYSKQTLISAENIQFQQLIKAPDAAILAADIAKLGNVQGYEPVRDLIIDVLEKFKKELLFPDLVRQYFVRTFDFLFSNLLNSTELSSIQNREVIEHITNCSDIADLEKILVDLLKTLFPPLGVRKEILSILNYIDHHYNQKLTLSDIAEHVYLNESYICRIFKEEMDTSIFNYIHNVRMEHAARIIKEGKIPVKSVCFAVGIETPSYFYRLFKAHFGMSPVQYAKEFGQKTLSLEE